MPVSQTITFSATPPTIGENPTTFNYNAISCWNDLKDNIVPDLNIAFEQMNELEANVNAKEASTVASAVLAVGAANYKGEWVAGTYSQGQSVSYNGLRYISKVNTNTDTPPSAKWLQIGTSYEIANATGKSTPIDGDSIGLVDSAAANVLKKLTWSNLKATLKTYFDGFYATITNLNLKAPLASPAFTGTPTAPTPAAGDNSTKIATTAFVASKAPLASPAFTGTPTAPTPAAGDNSTKIATTAFVKAKSEADSIGVGQTWQNVTGSRSANVTYTNTTGKPIMVHLFLSGGEWADATGASFYVNGVDIGGIYSGAGWNTIDVMIPASNTYGISSGETFAKWFELR